MDEMLNRLRGVPLLLSSVGESEFVRALYVNPTRGEVTRDEMAEYDAKIAVHSNLLRMTEEDGRAWKPHQYIALLRHGRSRVLPVERISDHPGYAAGRSEPARGRLAMKSSTSCSTQRTARLPIQMGFGNLDSAISA